MNIAYQKNYEKKKAEILCKYVEMNANSQHRYLKWQQTKDRKFIAPTSTRRPKRKKKQLNERQIISRNTDRKNNKLKRLSSKERR